MPLRDHWWCILVAKYGAFLFTEIGAFVITDYTVKQNSVTQIAKHLITISKGKVRRIKSQFIVIHIEQLITLIFLRN
jgi:hypothetical protein